MKLTYTYFLAAVLILCTACGSSKVIDENTSFREMQSLCDAEVDRLTGHSVDFRDLTGQIDWDWYITEDLKPIPDSVIMNHFGEIPELKKWLGYQECYCELFYQKNDSVVFLVISNRVFNNNEANKYLVVLDHNNTAQLVLLLARIAKSPDDLFEVQSSFGDHKMNRLQIHSFVEDEQVFIDSISYYFETADYINYLLLNNDSIRIVR